MLRYFETTYRSVLCQFQQSKQCLLVVRQLILDTFFRELQTHFLIQTMREMFLGGEEIFNISREKVGTYTSKLKYLDLLKEKNDFWYINE